MESNRLGRDVSRERLGKEGGEEEGKADFGLIKVLECSH